MGADRKESSFFSLLDNIATDSAGGTLGGMGLEAMQVAENASWGNAAFADDLGIFGKCGMALGGLGMYGGARQASQGVDEWGTGDRARGAMDVAGGSASWLSGALSVAGPSAAEGLMTAYTGLGATAAGATGAAAVLPLVGAAAGGFAAGTALGQRGNDEAAELGLLGKNLDNTNKNFSDFAGNFGDDWRQDLVDGGMGEDAAWWLGLGATSLMSVPMAADAALLGIASLGADGIELGAKAIGGAANLAGDAWDCAGDGWNALFD